MTPDPNVNSVSHIISVSVAPVFLLSGIGSVLTVMTNRLARIIDRGRALDEKLTPDTPDPKIIEELVNLKRRAGFISWGIALCTLTAIEICSVIVILFLQELIDFRASLLVALLFIAAMLTFILGLVLFLREIRLATLSRRIGPP